MREIQKNRKKSSNLKLHRALVLDEIHKETKMLFAIFVEIYVCQLLVSKVTVGFRNDNNSC